MKTQITRRKFIACSGMALAASSAKPLAAQAVEPIIDIHQHTGYHGRTDQQFIAHQRAMGITKTIILPAGTYVDLPSTRNGRSNGLAARCTGNEDSVKLVKQLPGEMVFFANEVPDMPGARKNLEKYLKVGAIGIGEQKFHLDVESKPMMMIYDIAKEFGVPVLMHFQHNVYNLGFDRFHRILEKYSTVNFIGHAQTWWGNIDKNHDQKSMYPALGSKVTPGGITDLLLKNYSNMYADHSAGSGLRALMRDEEHTTAFMERHQDQLLYGSDCKDTIGRGPGCQGANTLKTLRRLAPSKKVERKILYGNSKKLFKF
ncbi:MAG: putative TIM-barrel fold metal-dependent hydrolase [Limisphaerales bacterium]|jgi:predicted TIM-barrel fold metal-dependent hydrolase